MWKTHAAPLCETMRASTGRCGKLLLLHTLFSRPVFPQVFKGFSVTFFDSFHRAVWKKDGGKDPSTSSG